MRVTMGSMLGRHIVQNAVPCTELFATSAQQIWGINSEHELVHNAVYYGFNNAWYACCAQCCSTNSQSSWQLVRNTGGSPASTTRCIMSVDNGSTMLGRHVGYSATHQPSRPQSGPQELITTAAHYGQPPCTLYANCETSCGRALYCKGTRYLLA